MSKEGPRVLSYLGHMFQAIQRIKRYTGDMTEASFLENELVQDDVSQQGIPVVRSDGRTVHEDVKKLSAWFKKGAKKG